MIHRLAYRWQPVNDVFILVESQMKRIEPFM